MMILKLALRNLIGAGLKTWLKVAVLSLCYVLIVWTFGLYEGMYKQISRAMIEHEIGGGQYWHRSYDPYDPLTLDDSHALIPEELKVKIENKEAVPILIRQGSISLQGRWQSILLKGIEPEQEVLNIPTKILQTEKDALPVLIGTRMGKSNSLRKGDYLIIRWRDVNGTFDAIEGKIVEIMNTQVPTIDVGQLWVPLDKLQKMTELEGEATIIVVDKKNKLQMDFPDWKFRNHDFLLRDINEIVRGKAVSASIIYFILLFIVMLAIFDTQILSIFRRRKEIGTLMALGMQRFQVVLLFTLEGVLIGVLSAIIAFIYGTPLIYLTATKGLSLISQEAMDEYGLALGAKLLPSYSLSLILIAVLLIMLATTLVSYLPSRKIYKIKAPEAIKGKIL